MSALTYEELMAANLGTSTKKYWQCGTCSTTENVYFYFITHQYIPNEINVRCVYCANYIVASINQLTDKEVFLIKLRRDF